MFFSCSSFPFSYYSVTRKASTGGSCLSAHTNYFSLFLLLDMFVFALMLPFKVPSWESRELRMINGRSPEEEFHSLRRQSFHGLTAAGDPPCPPPRRSPLSRAAGGGRAESGLVCPRLLYELGCLHSKGSVAETLREGRSGKDHSVVTEILLIWNSRCETGAAGNWRSWKLEQLGTGEAGRRVFCRSIC